MTLVLLNMKLLKSLEFKSIVYWTALGRGWQNPVLLISLGPVLLKYIYTKPLTGSIEKIQSVKSSKKSLMSSLISSIVSSNQSVASSCTGRANTQHETLVSKRTGNWKIHYCPYAWQYYPGNSRMSHKMTLPSHRFWSQQTLWCDVFPQFEKEYGHFLHLSVWANAMTVL